MDEELDKALALLEQVCGSVQATLADHQTIQRALLVIKARVSVPLNGSVPEEVKSDV